MDILDTIEEQIQEDRVVLYMKGSPTFPQCGFSAKVVQMLDQCGTEYKSYDVLLESGLREGIKDFSDWPTIPQLYIDGEFIGGCDIVAEMYQKGELQDFLDGE